jgi:ribosomal protein S21
MANVVRVRVELKKKYNDPYKNFKEMFQEFKRHVSNAGILHDYKEHQYYESKSEKDHKARRDSAKKALMEDIEQKLVTGQKVNAPAGLIKKVRANLLKDKKYRKKGRKHYRNYDE